MDTNLSAAVEGQADVLFNRVGEHIATITFNRPDARNAMTDEMASAIHNFVLETEKDPTIHIGIVTGIGKAFSGGADLKAKARGRDIRTKRSGGFAGFNETTRTKPWIAAVNGAAFGGGMELVLACDMCVASEEATFAVPEVKRGIVALGGGAVLLPRKIPVAIAMEILLTGNPITAARAYELGMINRVVPKHLVMEEAVRLAESILENSRSSIRETLRLAKATIDNPLDEMWRQAAITRHLVFHTPDYKEGPRAFVEKRKPNWEDG
jgi:enoyl-CoA hydratase/carnithine racemase